MQKRRLEVSAAADERADAARAAHQAKLLRAEQQAAVVQERKQQQTVDLQKRSKIAALRNQAIHDKRYRTHRQLFYAYLSATNVITYR